MTHAYSSRLDEATQLALSSFRPVWRKGSRVPYITHLFSVTALVGEHGGDEDQMVAAMLHDWLEDIPGATVAELEGRFGPRVAGLVLALSDTMEHPKPPWRPRKEAYIRKLRGEHPDVKLVSAADKLHNVQTVIMDHRLMGDAIFDRFTGRRDGTLWYYREVHDALAEGWHSPLLDRLKEEVDALHLRAEEPPGAPPAP
ncbi:MAG: HD domain-containing protein [Alphaproteobacteria bacterium]|nr:HD domain-containing protein [Alphaproteobacteria bacterium]